ncbi:MAG: protein kinase [Gammaproteobacteria bacterium]|nr:protein kinase [Gammaproteobacteria bacterium]
MENLPDKVGKYDIVDVLGRGSMGVVYKGHDPYVDRLVAIKVASNIDRGEEASEMAQRMFVNEARSAGRLDHANILKVYEAGEADGRPYMVMEYVDGGDTLRSYCKPDALLPIKEVVRLVRQCADALDYAHRSGVLHRDIKPANVMLTRDGNAKIGDFGIARRVGADQTQIVGWFGSPLYMSPEQAQDAEVTQQSDLFSLGSLCYELLAGTPPFLAKGLTGLIQKVVNEDPVPLPQVRPEIPQRLWRVVQTMLAKKLEQRYREGAQIVAELDQVLAELQYAPVQLSDEEKIARMRQLRFFRQFTPGELKEVARAARWERRPIDDVVFAEGSAEEAFFVVADGLVELTMDGAPIRDLEAGDCFGEMGYLQNRPRIGTVKVRRDATLIRIEKDLKSWASLPCQMRFFRVFQDILIDRLRETMKALAKALR